MKPEALCTCTGGPPGPEMMRLSVGGLNRYFLCTRCKAIREEGCRRDGTIAHVRRHQVGREALSQTVRQQAKKILDLLGYEQMSRFDEDG